MVGLICKAFYSVALFYVQLTPKTKTFIYAFGIGWACCSYSAEIKGGITLCLNHVCEFII
jgi:hypothetical protein